MSMSNPQVPVPLWRSNLGMAEASARIRREIQEWAGSEALRSLVMEWGVEPPARGDLLQMLRWLDRFSAQQWDFRQGAERNLAAEPTLTPKQEHAATAAASALGLAAARPPEGKAYDHVLVLGGLLRACIVRPRYAAALVEDGLEVGDITGLCGFRPLRGDEIEMAQRFVPGVKDEFDAMVVGMQEAFDVPGPLTSPVSSGGRGNSDWCVARLSSSPTINVIAAPSSDPVNRRANTSDTYDWWARRNEPLKEARILLITTPIYVPYQGAGAIRVLGVGHGASVETVGVPETYSNLGSGSQRFGPHNYLQELRSAIRGYLSLVEILPS